MTKQKTALPLASDLDQLLSDAFMKRLCIRGEIPPSEAAGFTESVRDQVRSYLQTKSYRDPQIGVELKNLATLTRRALQLAWRKTPRPGEFDAVLKVISKRLGNLSEGAQYYLLRSGQRIILAPNEAPSDPAFS